LKKPCQTFPSAAFSDHVAMLGLDI
jgi:hypothetical protein